MSAVARTSLLPARPVQVATPATRVAVVIVTWNRKRAVDAVLGALAGQAGNEGPEGSVSLAPIMDVAVIDNGSGDGTAAHLVDRWRPERLIDNDTAEADRPAFVGGETAPGTENAGGFASLTIVRNTHNLGGCGGFNTGFAWAERLAREPEFVWLVDDDVDLPPGALWRLVATARSDGGIGLVGSRTVDFADRRTTIETTIYFDFENGCMVPEPPPGHRQHDSHRAWVAEVGGTKGDRAFTGRRDVDVLSACSLLARWDAVKRVGYWDRRYFIYCDDADWCLRFAKAGYRVVLDLDAVVYHTYWLAKLTPGRGYYAERNLAWMCRKVLGGRALRRSARRRVGALLLHARKAAMHCRLFHAEVFRRTVDDMVRGRGGRLDDEGPAPEPLLAALDRTGALRADSEVLVMCSAPESIAWADDLRARVTHGLLEAGRMQDQPRWVYLSPPGVHDPGPRVRQPRRVRFLPSRASKWRTQRGYLRNPPAAVVVFDQRNDFPLIRSRWNVHIDRRRPEMAQAERDGLRLRIAFFGRWCRTAARAAWYALTVRPRAHEGRYG
ncbi:MAG: glycosyltransferase family 2 protein [Phycisphaerales bacterium]|nr:glycosyltransferase family 2 protein [Phycisphaerales bacterium]